MSLCRWGKWRLGELRKMPSVTKLRYSRAYNWTALCLILWSSHWYPFPRVFKSTFQVSSTQEFFTQMAQSLWIFSIFAPKNGPQHWWGSCLWWHMNRAWTWGAGVSTHGQKRFPTQCKGPAAGRKSKVQMNDTEGFENSKCGPGLWCCYKAVFVNVVCDAPSLQQFAKAAQYVLFNSFQFVIFKCLDI